ncbi:MAG TPA: hypothetical protein VK929_17405 [Longimicrobiales bacterium]|nr:hypothetical protein [Longimicrobiales bacterium]
MTYERITAAPTREVLRLAEEVLTARLPLTVAERDSHSITLEGGDGTVTITVHRHGLDGQVHAATDQLRTSRLDLDVQYFMTLLPYQPEDVRGAGDALPGGLSRN